LHGHHDFSILGSTDGKMPRLNILIKYSVTLSQLANSVKYIITEAVLIYLNIIIRLHIKAHKNIQKISWYGALNQTRNLCRITQKHRLLIVGLSIGWNEKT